MATEMLHNLLLGASVSFWAVIIVLAVADVWRAFPRTRRAIADLLTRRR